MFINGIELLKEQIDVIEKIYNSFKIDFPNIQILPKKQILGIGEIDKHLMCYFSIEGNSFFIKFKNYPPILYYHNINLSKYINETIFLFKNNDFTLKNNHNKNEKPNSLDNSFNSNLSVFKDSSIDTLFNTYYSSLKMISNEIGKTSFDGCSNRLKNVLYRNRIYTINDLKLRDCDNLIKLKNFGSKCLWELCEFLVKIKNQNKTNEKEEINSPEINEIDEHIKSKFSMLEYIEQIRNKSFSPDMTTAYIDYINNTDEYNLLFIEFIEFFTNAARLKLTPREQSIFYARMGINEEPKTLQEIGIAHNVTRERIRQIINKSIRKLKTKRLSTFELIENEFKRCKLLDKLSNLSIGGFIAYLYFECDSYQIMPLIYLFIFDHKIELDFIKTTLAKQSSQYKQTLKNLEKQKEFNNEIFNLLSNQDMRKISDESYFRLKTERDVNTDNPILSKFYYNNEVYACESYLEKKVLEKLLSSKSFKYIKTQSIKIHHGNSFYYPDFQCLTNDNQLVIIEVKPLLKMCEYRNVEKFKSLKAFCEKYKFGYLIIDDRNNEFFHIDENNENFNTQILNKLSTNHKIQYNEYKEIWNNTKATLKNLLTLIKCKNINLTFPFKLTLQ